MTSILYMRLYSYSQILSLPFKFALSEFFMFSRDQLVFIAKCHRFVMCLALILLGTCTVTILVRAQSTSRLLQEMDKQDRRIASVEEEVKSIRIDQAITMTTFKSMSEKMNAGIGLLGVIASTLIVQFAAAVFKMMWGAALRDTVAQEYDRRKVKVGEDG
jgi:hypothetical protein